MKILEYLDTKAYYKDYNTNKYLVHTILTYNFILMVIIYLNVKVFTSRSLPLDQIIVVPKFFFRSLVIYNNWRRNSVLDHLA